MLDLVSRVRKVQIVDDRLALPRQVRQHDAELELAPAILRDAEGRRSRHLFGFVAEGFVEVVGHRGEDLGGDVGFGLCVEEDDSDGPVAEGEARHAGVGVGAKVVLGKGLLRRGEAGGRKCDRRKAKVVDAVSGSWDFLDRRWK